MSAPAADNLLYFGTSEPPEATRALAAGALTAEYIGGALRNIRYKGREVLREIAYIVRDQDWGTCAPQIDDLEIYEEADMFRVRYQARCVNAEHGQALRYHVEMRASASGQLAVEACYRAETRFLTCRNGFCVLHPIEGVAGQPVAVRHPGGALETAHFPAQIAPWQPFKEIESITWSVDESIAATCRFQGDIFEMEDQRNWSDASFKTYVRPLARPWPYWIEAGEAGTQAVSLAVTGRNAAWPASVAAAPAVLRVLPAQPDSARLPAIGVAMGAAQLNTIQDNISLLSTLGAQVVLCEYDPGAGDDAATLAGYAAIAARYPGRYVLECVLPGVRSPSDELGEIAAQVHAAGLVPDGLAVFPAADRKSVPPGSAWPPCPALSEVYAAVRAHFPATPLGGGMYSYFTELNRKRPPFEQLDWVTHATNPIVHAAGDASVMQTLEAIPHIVRSCRALIGLEKPYWIGPVTLGMRQNPYGSRTKPNPDGLRIPMAASDPRERAQFGAAWLLGYASRVQDAALEVLTVGPLLGERGLSANGMPFPMYHIVQALAQLAGSMRLLCRSSLPAQVLGLGASDDTGAVTLWVANITAQEQTFCLDSGTPAGARIERVLGAQGLQVLQAPAPELISLPPYACLQLRWQDNPSI